MKLKANDIEANMDPAVNILLVDDQPANLLALESVLENPEYNLVKATSGQEALRRLLQDDEFAVILLDIRMAGMDGFETAALLRERKKTRHLPIIFLTAMVKDNAWVSHGYALGAVDYLLKPLDPDILRAKVAVFVELFKKNRELRRQTAELTRAKEQLDSFCYSVSHDLRTPLRRMSGFLEMLQIDCAACLDDTARDYVGSISKACVKMSALIDDLLSFSKMMRADFRSAKVKMTELVQEALQDLAHDTQGRKIDWHIDLLPEVTGDRSMLKQVWVNLLSNAVKYTQRRDRAVVAVRCEQTPGAEWRFSVQDNGAGFDMEYADKLFGVFQRLHSEGEFEGTGIGLANVRRIVERHQGRTWAVAKVDQGATFYFTLPVNSAQD